MAQPVIVPCPANAWTKVLDGVRVGQVWIQDTTPRVYLQTYREGGDPVPTTKDEGVEFVGRVMGVSALKDIDVYIYPENEDGIVRVDT
jgi:hypothetical protein